MQHRVDAGDERAAAAIRAVDKALYTVLEHTLDVARAEIMADNDDLQAGQPTNQPVVQLSAAGPLTK
ncbi:MAG: hypothetical protein OHK0046_47220 [Anaerolineae bacterium]